MNFAICADLFLAEGFTELESTGRDRIGAMAIGCCNPAVTTALHGVPVATTSECGSAMKQGSLLVRPSLCPSLRSGRRLMNVASSPQRLQLVVASYGIPEYGAPRPYQAPGVHTPNPNPTIVNPGFHDLGKNAFWEYSAPSDYSTPVNYKTPKGYGTPAAYGPGVGVAEDVAVELGQEGVTLEEVKEMELDAGDGGNGGGGGGDDNGGGGGGRGDGSGGADGEGKGKKTGMSMSQKLTLAYAILVGGACKSSLCPSSLFKPQSHCICCTSCISCT